MAEYVDAWVPGWTPETDGILKELGYSAAVAKAPTKAKTSAAWIDASNVQQAAKKTLDSGGRLVYAAGGAESVNRLIVESHEVDVIWNTHESEVRDLLNYRAGGLDDAAVNIMAEHKIMMGFSLSSFLSAQYGRQRAFWLGRARQDVRFARKKKVPVVVASGAADEWGIRAPMELIAFGMLLGLNQEEAVNSVLKNPLCLLKKAENRGDPNVILKGLTVTSWGSTSQPKSKRQYGWY
ncbi:Ribonuclease P protein component 3 [uncultured archaeon]|nr:Ribonuclease P protein component 3 [uncultured archaeon]